MTAVHQPQPGDRYAAPWGEYCVVRVEADRVVLRGSIEIDTTFRTKKPHAPIPKTKVWTDDEGTILTADPRQDVLPFRRPGPRETT